MKRILILLLLILLAGGGWLGYALNHRPDPATYEALWLAPAGSEPGQLRVTSLGVSTLLISDGETAFMTDGFFSRPGLFKVAATRLSANRERITEGLKKAGINELVAVLVVHSHYDHAMDAPEVAEMTGAVLVGSESTANIGRGAGLPEDRILIVNGGEVMRFGKFRLTLVKSQHFPHGKAMGEVDAPLVPPARATEYREGGSYSLLVAHPQASMLIQGSAGFVEGALKGKQADVVFLGIGLLGTKENAYMDAYWRETVQAVGAKRVIPIHWDDFFKPLTERPRAFPYLLDDFDASMRFLQRKASVEGVELRLAPAWVAIDPLAAQ